MRNRVGLTVLTPMAIDVLKTAMARERPCHFCSQKNGEFGEGPTIVAITEDGRGFVWHELIRLRRKSL